MRAPIKFSVIIPTRERADTLVHCLRTIVSQEYENLDIIVSDNFSQDGTKDVVASFTDRRIKYINTGKRVSMSHNWEFALGHVTEGWVMFLGDDDGLYPGALQTLDRLISEYKVEAVWSAFGSFLWPGHLDDSPGGVLSIPLTNSVKLKRSKDELKRVFSGSVVGSVLPWLYLGGAASINLINRARDADGRFFCSQIPDIYSAVALSCATDNYLSVGIPIAISGTSRHSNGMKWARAEANEDGQPILMLEPEGNIPFHDSLITGKSFQVIWYECYMQSWHIHQGSFGVTLASQLEVALNVSPPGQLKDVAEQCRLIAAKNGLSVTNKFQGPWYRLNRFVSLVRNMFSNITINAGQLNILNVNDAVIASGYLYKFLTDGPCGGKLYMVMINVRRAFLKIRNMVLK